MFEVPGQLQVWGNWLLGYVRQKSFLRHIDKMFNIQVCPSITGVENPGLLLL